MQLVTGQGDVTFVEGAADETIMPTLDEVNRLIEVCFSEGTRALLLYPANLPPGFFDLSTRVAGEVLQKLRNYNIRLAVVCPPGSVTFSSRFAELLADEQRGAYFAVFEGRAAAVTWLCGQ